MVTLRRKHRRPAMVLRLNPIPIPNCNPSANPSHSPNPNRPTMPLLTLTDPLFLQVNNNALATVLSRQYRSRLWYRQDLTVP